ncbi:MAG: HAD-IC family P-type ATPase [Thiolinea sp.]
MEMEGIGVPEHIKDVKASCDEQGHSLLYIAVDDDFVGAIELHPTLRPQIKRVIDQLHQRKLKTYIISGDNAKPTKKLADELSIDAYFAEVLPEDKANLIENLQQQGKKVCFVGDGINDSIALKKADVSISLSGASTIATDTAQIILMNGGLNHLPWLFNYADRLENNLRRGFALTIVPGVICVSSVYLLHLGVLGATLLYNAGLAAGVTNSMLLSDKNSETVNTEEE